MVNNKLEYDINFLYSQEKKICFYVLLYVHLCTLNKKTNRYDN